ncbi:phosphoribosylaminoimidazolesuccinocarboxamide synthase [Blattabacterium cuenoti]|uniref:phosphoribosylaminoimidazolesuccinocarboxamide synthase n=1 Tax=Blattabacterium cuenoti TaxID=1653831 RepID=UPI001933A702|nr:phosphoribosylaminoimidazolesuccinocarboxamide synthase [Blattabacterium cuenoti]
MNSSNIKKIDILSEGKTKKVYTTNDPLKVIIHYKDDLTAFNGLKKIFLPNKGIINNDITTLVFKFLNYYGIKTHFIQKINNREQLCQKVKIIPLEFVYRNIVTGSLSKRLGIKHGKKINEGIIEIFYKNDKLKDPLINDNHAVFLEIITYNELNFIYSIIKNINNILKTYFLNRNIILVDFKIEFGKNNKNEIILSDEITPDTCRFWDEKTMEKLDKDLFRMKLKKKEKIIEHYMEILKRLNK